MVGSNHSCSTGLFRLSRFFFKAWDFCKLCLEPWEIWREGSGYKENHFYSLPFGQAEATTSCKNVETLPRKNDLSCFKSLLVTGLWDIILTSLLPPIQSCSSKFWAWSCIASNFDKGWRGDHKHKIMDRPFIPKYGRVSQALLQLVVAFKFCREDRAKRLDNSCMRIHLLVKRNILISHRYSPKNGSCERCKIQV